MKEKVLLGMSGGVDSSVSAILLQNQGYEVIGITIKMFETNNENAVEDAKNVCKKLGIEHITVDLKKEFKEHVIDDFVCNYSKCRTPNPCVECNRFLKFKALYEIAKGMGINFIATGHYAKIEFNKEYDRYIIRKSDSEKKDQTYFLYNVEKEILGHVLFPLCNFKEKDEIRDIAKKYGLEVSRKPDSQDVCFIENNDYISFLERSGIEKKKGNIVDLEGNVLGKHEGLYKYTIGQRKGLGISYKCPLYVIGFDKQKNQVIVGEEKDLYKKDVYVEKINLLLVDKLEDGMEVKAKIRYSQKSNKAIIKVINENEIILSFEEPQRGATPGQSAVFYIDDILVGGGKIK